MSCHVVGQRPLQHIGEVLEIRGLLLVYLYDWETYKDPDPKQIQILAQIITSYTNNK